MSRIVRYQDDLVGICERASRHGAIAIDTETTGLYLHQTDVLRGISLAFGDESWYVPVSHPDSTNLSPGPIAKLLASTDALIMFHNAPFDLTSLGQARVKVKDNHLYDTQVADWLLDENLDHRLKEGAGARLLGTDVAMAEKTALAEIRDQGRDWPTFTAEDIGEYAADDAKITLAVGKDQLYRMTTQPMDDNPMADLCRENQFQWVLKDMMDTGIRVDEERAERQYQEQLARRSELAEKFANIQLPGTKLAGRGKARGPVPLYDLGVNMNSPKQLATLVYDLWGLDVYLRTDSGKRSTNKEALEPHAEVDSRIADLLAHRRADKACSGFYEPLARFAGSDGRVHPSFNSARTVTGRLACSAPNMQTVPRADVLAGIRACIIPADGCELWEFDLHSAELRVIGAVTKEAALFSAMAEGRDLHSETAAMIFGPDFTPLQRRLAKNLNYGYPYFIGAEKLARYIAAGPPRRPMTPDLIKQGRALKQKYAATYPRMTKMMKALENQARQRGTLPLSKPGRYRHFKTMRVKQGEPKYFTALNALVQGTVAELMKDVMLEFAGNVDARLCLQVHDSLVCEVAPGSGYEVQSQLQAIVDDCNVFSQMPMPIEAKEWS